MGLESSQLLGSQACTSALPKGADYPVRSLFGAPWAPSPPGSLRLFLPLPAGGGAGGLGVGWWRLGGGSVGSGRGGGGEGGGAGAKYVVILGGRVRFRLVVVGGGLESEVEGRLKEVWMSSCRNACGREGCCWGWEEVGAVGSGGVSGDPGACS